MNKDAVSIKDDGVYLHVRVQPKASRNAIKVESDGRIRVALTAPPVEGAANEALRKFFADTFKVARSAVFLVSGEKGREKTVLLQGLSLEYVQQILAKWGSG